MKHSYMLRFIGTTLALMLPAIAFADRPADKPEKPEKAEKQEKAKKADICHVTGNGTYRVINVNKSALQAHLDHGDAIPGSLAGNKLVTEDCALKETVRAESTPLAMGPMGWAGWSCPAGTTVVGGGYEPAEATVLISEAAAPESVSGLYPVYPHYTFPEGETGWVVQNSNAAQTLTVYAICVAP